MVKKIHKNFHLYAAVRLNDPEEMRKLSEKLKANGVPNQGYSYIIVAHLTATSFAELKASSHNLQEALLKYYPFILSACIKMFSECEYGDKTGFISEEAIDDYDNFSKNFLHSKLKIYKDGSGIEVNYAQY